LRVFLSFYFRDALQEGSAYAVACLKLRHAGVFPLVVSLPIGGLQFPVLLVKHLIFLHFGTHGSRHLLDISLLN
jgi:hypothetical protein